jgi:ribosome-associated protein
MAESLEIAPGLTSPGRDLSVAFARSSGPGGQNVNKVSTKVELRLDLRGTGALGEAVKGRLRTLAHGRLDAEGRLVVTSQRRRTRAANLRDAREKLRSWILQALPEPVRRTPTRPSAGARERRLSDKRERARTKRGRVRSRSRSIEED